MFYVCMYHVCISKNVRLIYDQYNSMAVLVWFFGHFGLWPFWTYPLIFSPVAKVVDTLLELKN